MKSSFRGRIILAITIFLLLAVSTFAYFLDSQASGAARVYEFLQPPSGTYNSTEAENSGAYPVSAYEIDVGELKAVNQFSSKLRLSKFTFVPIDNDQRSGGDREIRDVRLRFYFSSRSEHQKPLFKVDSVVSIINAPIQHSKLDVENLPTKEFVWTASEYSSVLYPFDRYVLSLMTEEQVDSPPAVTNSPPETFSVRLTNPRFIASQYVRGSAGGLDIGFIVLKRPWLLRGLAVCLLVVSLIFIYYLFTLKTPKEFLPGTLGYVAGVWGMRNIVSADAPMFPTITDYISLVLLGVVALLVVAKLTFLKQQTESTHAE